MYSNYSTKLESKITNIFVGEYYVTTEEEVISTLLGSCISVCLMDNTKGIYGMNHFLLPGESYVKDEEDAKFGAHSMEMLIDAMIKKGANLEDMQAKVFGGGKIIETPSDIITVNRDNINFTRSFLDSKKIPLLAEDVGGVQGRRIFFYTSDGSVYVEKVRKSSACKADII